MHYACIAPTAYLDQYAGRGHFQLCLANVAIRDAAYFEWYRKRREAGDFVILDNGAYEGELVTFDELCRVGRELNAQVVTVPDKINDAGESHRIAKDFLSECWRHLDETKTTLMRVLQHESREVRAWDLLQYDLSQEFDYTWIAYPRVLGEMRPKIISETTKTTLAGDGMNVHAFGWTGNLNEVRQLAKLGVTSIDTSAPVWRGIHGLDLGNENVAAWEKHGPKFDPNYSLALFEQEQIVESNLASMQRACVAF